jgi:hypothetical protein
VTAANSTSTENDSKDNGQKPSATSTLGPMLEAMLEKYAELDEDSRKMLVQNALKR